MLQRCFADVAHINWTGRKLLLSLYSACRQPINGNATYNYILFIYGGLLVVESFFFYVIEGFVLSVNSLFFTSLPYKVLYCIFTNFAVMSAKDTFRNLPTT